MSDLFATFLLNRFRNAAKPVEISRGTPVAACFQNLNLIEIPRVMRERNLFKGAEIMEHWFLGKPFVMPAAWKVGEDAADPRTISPEHINSTIITMQWALDFPRALGAYKDLKNAVYGNLKKSSLEASQVELFKNLQRDGKFTKKLSSLVLAMRGYFIKRHTSIPAL